MTPRYILLAPLLCAVLSGLLPQQGLAETGKGKLIAVLIQVDTYGEGLKLESPFSLDRSAQVMKDAIQRLGIASGYAKSDVQICEIVETANTASESGRAKKNKADKQKHIPVPIKSVDEGPLGQWCRSKDSKGKRPQPEREDIEYVLNNIRDLSSLSPERDTYILYFTGHGESTGTDIELHVKGSSTKRRYFTSLNKVINDMFMKDTEGNLKKGRKVIFLDTCQTQRTSLVKTVLNTSELSKFDVSIFLSSNAHHNSPSYIDPVNRTGYFTRVLADALEGEALNRRLETKPKTRTDLSLTMKDLEEYIASEVPQVIKSDLNMLVSLLDKSVATELREHAEAGKEIQTPSFILPVQDRGEIGSTFYVRASGEKASLSFWIQSHPALKDIIDALEDLHVQGNVIGNVAIGDVISSARGSSLKAVRDCNQSQIEEFLATSQIEANRSWKHGFYIVIGYIEPRFSTKAKGKPQWSDGGILHACFVSRAKKSAKIESINLGAYPFDLIEKQDYQVPVTQILHWLVNAVASGTTLERSRRVFLAFSWEQDTVSGGSVEGSDEICVEFPGHLTRHLNLRRLASDGYTFIPDSRLHNSLCQHLPDRQDVLRELLAHMKPDMIFDGMLQVKGTAIEASASLMQHDLANGPNFTLDMGKEVMKACLPINVKLMNGKNGQEYAMSSVRHLARHVADAIGANPQWTVNEILPQDGCE